MTVNNPKNTDAIVDAVRKNISSSTGQQTLVKANTVGLAPTLQSILNADETVPVEVPDSNVSRPQLVYGQAWLEAKDVKRTLLTSATDPGRALERFVFPTGIGQNVGIVGVEPLTNIRINDEPIVDPDTGLANFGDVVLNEFLNAGGSLLVDQLLPKSTIGETDPITGERISKLDNLEKKVTGQRLGDLVDVDDTSSCGDEVMYYDGDKCKWVTKHINDFIIQVNPALEIPAP